MQARELKKAAERERERVLDLLACWVGKMTKREVIKAILALEVEGTRE